jgi:hypothetical protein
VRRRWAAGGHLYIRALHDEIEWLPTTRRNASSAAACPAGLQEAALLIRRPAALFIIIHLHRALDYNNRGSGSAARRRSCTTILTCSRLQVSAVFNVDHRRNVSTAPPHDATQGFSSSAR